MLFVENSSKNIIPCLLSSNYFNWFTIQPTAKRFKNPQRLCSAASKLRYNRGMSRKIELPTAAEMKKFHNQSHQRTFWSRFSMPQRLTLGFLSVITIGALLLMLPISHYGNMRHSFLNALFTSTSAASVTGLTVVDTATHWTLFGQIVIMCLIEVGALGFMSFSVLLFTATKRQMDLRKRMLIQ